MLSKSRKISRLLSRVVSTCQDCSRMSLEQPFLPKALILQTKPLLRKDRRQFQTFLIHRIRILASWIITLISISRSTYLLLWSPVQFSPLPFGVDCLLRCGNHPTLLGNGSHCRVEIVQKHSRYSPCLIPWVSWTRFPSRIFSLCSCWTRQLPRRR
jgi:hypothetical protein